MSDANKKPTICFECQHASIDDHFDKTWVCKAAGKGLATSTDLTTGRVLERKVSVNGTDVYYSPVNVTFLASPYPPTTKINNGNCPLYVPVRKWSTKVLRRLGIV